MRLLPAIFYGLAWGMVLVALDPQGIGFALGSMIGFAVAFFIVVSTDRDAP